MRVRLPLGNNPGSNKSNEDHRTCADRKQAGDRGRSMLAI